MPARDKRPAKFDIFLKDNRGTPLADLSSGRFNARKLVDMLSGKLDVIDLCDVYMELHFVLGRPDEDDRLFFNTLIGFDRDRLKTALRLRLVKGTVAMRLCRLRKLLKKADPPTSS